LCAAGGLGSIPAEARGQSSLAEDAATGRGDHRALPKVGNSDAGRFVRPRTSVALDGGLSVYVFSGCHRGNGGQWARSEEGTVVGYFRGMTEEHDIAYTAVGHGTQVRSSDGKVVGTVERVLDIADFDLFDGIVVETSEGDRFVDRDQIARITNKAIYCAITADEAATLPVPDSAPTYRADSGHIGGNSPAAWIRRLFGHAKWRRERDED
jgi:hypothetical protein